MISRSEGRVSEIEYSYSAHSTVPAMAHAIPTINATSSTLKLAPNTDVAISIATEEPVVEAAMSSWGETLKMRLNACRGE